MLRRADRSHQNFQVPCIREGVLLAPRHHRRSEFYATTASPTEARTNLGKSRSLDPGPGNLRGRTRCRIITILSTQSFEFFGEMWSDANWNWYSLCVDRLRDPTTQALKPVLRGTKFADVRSMISSSRASCSSGLQFLSSKPCIQLPTDKVNGSSFFFREDFQRSSFPLRAGSSASPGQRARVAPLVRPPTCLQSSGQKRDARPRDARLCDGLRKRRPLPEAARRSQDCW